MNKIRVIDLLNKIANGEKIKAFEYCGGIYELTDSGEYWYGDIYFEVSTFPRDLNDEVEIIEDKKLEKIEMQGFSLFDVADKVNEIIDYINKGDKE